MLFSILILLTTIIITISSFALLSSAKPTKENGERFYLGLAFLALAAWGFTTIINSTSSNYGLVLLSTKMSYVSGVAIIIAFHFFGLTLSKAKKWFTIANIGAITIGLLMMLLTIFGDVIVRDIEFETSIGSKPVLGDWFVIYAVALVPFLLIATRNIFRAFREGHGRELLRLRYLFLGMGVTSVLLLTTNLLLPIVGTDQFVPIGFIWTIPMVILTAYSFLFKRTYDVQYIFGQLLFYGLLVVLLFITYYFVTWIQVELWGTVFTTNAYVLGVIIAVIFIFTARYVAVGLRSWVSTQVVFKKSDPKIVLNSIRTELSRETEMKTILDSGINAIQNLLDVSYVYYLLPFENSEGFQQYVKQDIQADQFSEEFATQLMKMLTKQQKQLLVVEDCTDKKIQEVLKDSEVSAVGLLGESMVIIGSVSGDQAYTVNTVQSLEDIISVLSIAISRATVYQKLQHFNSELTEKVKEATSELEQRNVQLKETLKKERDILDILGHELRTPVGIVRNSIQMINRFRGTEKLTDEKLDEYLAMGNDNSIRLAKILETIFTSSRISSNSLALNPGKVVLADVVNKSIKAFQNRGQKKGINLASQVASDIEVYADKEKVAQIVDNLIDNAIKYTDKGSITISSDKVGDFVRLIVQDTGVGIPSELVPQLGQRFYRVDTYLESNKELDVVRPGGTGLGLYVVYNLAKLMGGKVEIQSEVGKGTTFHVLLPVYSGQKDKLGPKK